MSTSPTVYFFFQICLLRHLHTVSNHQPHQSLIETSSHCCCCVQDDDTNPTSYRSWALGEPYIPHNDTNSHVCAVFLPSASDPENQLRPLWAARLCPPAPAKTDRLPSVCQRAGMSVGRTLSIIAPDAGSVALEWGGGTVVGAGKVCVRLCLYLYLFCICICICISLSLSLSLFFWARKTTLLILTTITTPVAPADCGRAGHIERGR